jgi:hypothetical protein
VKGNLKNENIYYTLDGTDPDSTSLVYKEPINLKESSQFKTRSYKKNWYPSDIVIRDYNKVKYKIEKVTVKYQPEESYPGIQKLIDLEKGTVNFKDGNWNGYHKDAIATLDMGQSVEFNSLVVNCLKSISNYIFYPLEIIVYAGDHPDSLNRIKKLDIPLSDRNREIEIKSFKIDLKSTQNARYIKVYIKNMKKNPQWHEAPGAQSWLFIDEIMIL